MRAYRRPRAAQEDNAAASQQNNPVLIGHATSEDYH